MEPSLIQQFRVGSCDDLEKLIKDLIEITTLVDALPLPVISSERLELQKEGARYWNLAVDEKVSISSNKMADMTNQLIAVSQLRSIGYKLFKKSVGNITIPFLLQLQFLSMACKCAKAYYRQGDLSKTRSWMQEAAVQFQFISTAHSSKALYPVETALGIFYYKVYYAGMVFYIDNQDASSFRLMQDAAEELPKSLRTLKPVKTIFSSCVKMAEEAKEYQTKVKWYQIAISAIEMSADSSIYKEFHKRSTLGLLSALIEGKDTLKATELYQSSIELLKTQPLFHAIGVRLLGLSKAPLNEYEDAFEFAKDCCLPNPAGSSQSQKISKEDLKHFSEMIHLISKSAGHEIALKCLSTITCTNNALVPHSATLQGSFLILTIFLLVENDVPDAIQQANAAFERVTFLDLNSEVSRSCLLLLWKAGDSFAMKRDWNSAIEWFSLAMKLLSVNECDYENKAALLRKIAMCHVEARNFPAALEVCEKASNTNPKNPMNMYLLFLIHLELDDTETALGHLLQIPFEERPEYFVGAADKAVNRGEKKLVLAILKAAVGHLRFDTPRMHAVTILRCLIQISFNELPNISEDISAVEAFFVSQVGYLKLALDLVKTPCDQPERFQTEVEGLVKAAWNISLYSFQNCPNECAKEYERNLSLITLLLQFLDISWLKRGPELEETKIYALYLYTYLALEFCRNVFAGGQTEVLNNALKTFYELKELFFEDMSPFIQDICFKIEFFELELFCRLKKWDKVMELFNALETVFSKRMRSADIVISLEPPIPILISVLGSFFLDQLPEYPDTVETRSLVKWARFLITAYLLNDIECVPGLCRQLSTILTKCYKSDYSQQDILYITIKLWNQGVDYWTIMDLDEAKVWLDLSLEMSQFCRDNARAKALTSTYPEFLEAYQEKV